MAIREYQPQQYMMLFSEPKEILGEDHLCFVVDDIVETLDLSRFPDKRKNCGAPCYDYRLLIKILFYGYATGTFSSRKLMCATQENLAYLYLTRQQAPNFRTISDFRKNHSILIKDAFASIVRMAAELGMLKLGCVALDGSKIKASANRDKDISQKHLKEEMRQIEEALEKGIKIDEEEDKIFGKDKTGSELPEDIRGQAKRLKKIRQLLSRAEAAGKEKINPTDPEAAYMKDKAGFALSYNCQVAVDADSKLIVAEEVSSNPADQEAVKKQLSSIKENLGKKPEKVLADSGHYSVDNLIYLEKEGIDSYMPHQNDARDKKHIYKEKPRLFDKRCFKYDTIKDQYVCPEGNILSKKSALLKRDITFYQAKACHGCQSKNLCTHSKKGLRIISRYKREDLIEKMRFKLTTEDGHKQYRRRAPTVETPFAHFKKNLAFRQFFCRGRLSVSTEFKLLCIGYNIRKIARFLHTKTGISALEPVYC